MKVLPTLTNFNPSTFIRDYLVACGIKEKDVESYLRADISHIQSPWLYPDMDKAVDRLEKGIKEKERIGILIDCDHDGYSSAAIIYQFIRSQSPDHSITVYHHVGKEHGLSQNKDEDIVAQILESQVTLLLIPDAGTNDNKPCKILKEAGVDIIITDHHEINERNSHAIIINPHRDPTHLNTSLSGCGVTYKFICACADKWDVDIGYRYLDFVASSIVTDVCSMLSLENRAYVSTGLNHLTSQPLIDFFEKANRRGNNPTGISWGIGPMVNAVTRSNNMEIKTLLFFALVGEADIYEAVSAARKAHNNQSKITTQLVNEIEPTLEDSHDLMIGYIQKEYKTYTGLIANKLQGRYHKPTFVLREYTPTQWSGSLRSPIPLAEQINETGLASCQGHSAACGVLVKKSALPRLVQWIDEQGFDFSPDIPIVAKINPTQISIELCQDCEDNMMLWSGSENAGLPLPRFYLSFATWPTDVDVFRKKSTTVKIRKDGVDFLKFQEKDEDVVQLLTSTKCKVEVVVTLQTNEWNGTISPQAIIEQWEITDNENWEDLF